MSCPARTRPSSTISARFTVNGPTALPSKATATSIVSWWAAARSCRWTSGTTVPSASWPATASRPEVSLALAPRGGCRRRAGLGVERQDVAQIGAFVRSHFDQRPAGHGVEVLLHQVIGAGGVAVFERRDNGPVFADRAFGGVRPAVEGKDQAGSRR